MGKAVVGTDVGRGVGGIVVGETVLGETVLGAKVVGKGNGTTDGGAVVRLWIGDEGVIVGFGAVSAASAVISFSFCAVEEQLSIILKEYTSSGASS